jgi:hypothetical protein
MALGVHLPHCPCARCQASAPLVERIKSGARAPDPKTAGVAGGAALPRGRRNPWAEPETEEE